MSKKRNLKKIGKNEEKKGKVEKNEEDIAAAEDPRRGWRERETPVSRSHKESPAAHKVALDFYLASSRSRREGGRGIGSCARTLVNFASSRMPNDSTTRNLAVTHILRRRRWRERGACAAGTAETARLRGTRVLLRARSERTGTSGRGFDVCNRGTLFWGHIFRGYFMCVGEQYNFFCRVSICVCHKFEETLSQVYRYS